MRCIVPDIQGTGTRLLLLSEAVKDPGTEVSPYGAGEILLRNLRFGTYADGIMCRHGGFEGRLEAAGT